MSSTIESRWTYSKKKTTSNHKLIHEAAGKGSRKCNVEKLEQLLKKVPNPFIADQSGHWTLFHYAAKGNYPEIVELLVNQFSAEDGINVPDKFGSLPIHLAAADGNEQVLSALLKHGGSAKINVKNDGGYTALHKAASLGHGRCVKVLLQYQADPFIRNMMNLTPRALVPAKFPPIIEMLKEAEALPEKRRLEAELLQQQRDAEAQKAHELKATETLKMLQEERIQLEVSRRLAQEEAEKLSKTNSSPGRLLPSSIARSFQVELSQLNRVGDPIAKGSFGAVYKGTYYGNPVAIKYSIISDPTAFEKEIEAWSKLRHPNVVQLFAAGSLPDPLIVMELMEGSLANLLYDQPRVVLPWELRLELLMGVCAGLNYLHDMRMIHRDLKSYNILFKDKVAKLADFGTTRARSEDSSVAATAVHFVGSLRWLAPEIFNGQPATTKTDIYALGMTIFEMLTREHPFATLKSDGEVMKAVHLGNRPQISYLHVSEPNQPDLLPLIQKCWAIEPQVRPDVGDVYNFLSKFKAEILSPSTSPSLLLSTSSPLQSLLIMSSPPASLSNQPTIRGIRPKSNVSSSISIGSRGSSSPSPIGIKPPSIPGRTSPGGRPFRPLPQSPDLSSSMVGLEHSIVPSPAPSSPLPSPSISSEFIGMGHSFQFSPPHFFAQSASGSDMIGMEHSISSNNLPPTSKTTVNMGFSFIGMDP